MSIVIQGSAYDHAKDYAEPCLPSGARMSVVAGIAPPRSPLFHAALELLKGNADRAALLLTLRDRFPGRSVHEIDQVLRETAVLFHCQGVAPK